jgi:hypothetical protein
MLVVLYLLRFARRQRKNLPGWGDETYKFIFETADTILSLTPTLFAILLTPLHFFERLPIYCKKQRQTPPPYQTFLAFAFSTSTVMLGAMGLSKEALGGALYFFLLILTLVLLLPIIVPFACFPCAIVAYLIHFGRYRRFGMPNRSVLRLFVPVRPSSYRNLNKERYFKGLFYYYGYLLFVSIPAVLTVFALGALDYALPDALVANLIGRFAEVAAVWVTARIVFYPYAALLIASSKTPTKSMNRLVYWNIERSARKLLGACESVNKIKTHPRTTEAIREKRRAAADQAADEFTAACNSGRKAYLHSCIVREQNADDRLFFGEALRCLPWSKLAAETRTVPFKPSIREQMRVSFAAAGVPWDQQIVGGCALRSRISGGGASGSGIRTCRQRGANNGRVENWRTG